MGRKNKEEEIVREGRGEIETEKEGRKGAKNKISSLILKIPVCGPEIPYGVGVGGRGMINGRRGQNHGNSSVPKSSNGPGE